MQFRAWQCSECCGRGQVPDKRKLPKLPVGGLILSWMDCPACGGSGKVAAPTLFKWPPRPGRTKDTADVCDQCERGGTLWSFELAGDETVLCESCLKSLHEAIGKAVLSG